MYYILGFELNYHKSTPLRIILRHIFKIISIFTKYVFWEHKTHLKYLQRVLEILCKRTAQTLIVINVRIYYTKNESLNNFNT